jgi:hypothetical protein
LPLPIQPELLDGVCVIVWVTTEQHMSHFKPMPKPIMSGLGTVQAEHDAENSRLQ